MMTNITIQGIYTHSMLTAQCPVPGTDHGGQRAELCCQLSQSTLLNLTLPRKSAITVPSFRYLHDGPTSLKHAGGRWIP